MSIKMSAIIPYTGHDPLREGALALLMDACQAQDYYNIDANNNPTNKAYEIIFVEQATSDDYVFHENLPVDKHIKLRYNGVFNKSWCMNVGAREASSDSIIFIDSDMIFGKEYFDKLRRFHRDIKNPFFVGWNYIFCLPGRDNPIVRVIDKDKTLTAGGVFWVQKDFYFGVIGGMNENYFGYGAEDNDFWKRASLHIDNVHYMSYPLAHVYHHWAAPSEERFYHLNRTLQYPQQVTERLKKANLGKKECPTVIDVSDLQLVDAGIETGKNAKGIVS